VPANQQHKRHGNFLGRQVFIDLSKEEKSRSEEIAKPLT